MISSFAPNYSLLAGLSIVAGAMSLGYCCKHRKASALPVKPPSINLDSSADAAERYAHLVIRDSGFSKEIDQKVYTWVKKYYQYIHPKNGFLHPNYKVSDGFLPRQQELLSRCAELFKRFELEVTDTLFPKKPESDFCAKRFVLKSALTAGILVLFHFNLVIGGISGLLIFKFDCLKQAFIDPYFFTTLQKILFFLIGGNRKNIESEIKKRIKENNFSGVCYGNSMAILKHLLSCENGIIDAKKFMEEKKLEILYFQLYQQISLMAAANSLIEELGGMKITCFNESYRNMGNFAENPEAFETAKKIHAIAIKLMQQDMLSHLPPKTKMSGVDLPAQDCEPINRIRDILLQPTDSIEKTCYEFSVKVAKTEDSQKQMRHSFLVFMDERRGIFQLYDSYIRYTEAMQFPDKQMLVDAVSELCQARYPEIYHFDQFTRTVSNQ